VGSRPGNAPGRPGPGQVQAPARRYGPHGRCRPDYRGRVPAGAGSHDRLAGPGTRRPPVSIHNATAASSRSCSPSTQGGERPAGTPRDVPQPPAGQTWIRLAAEQASRERRSPMRQRILGPDPAFPGTGEDGLGGASSLPPSQRPSASQGGPCSRPPASVVNLHRHRPRDTATSEAHPWGRISAARQGPPCAAVTKLRRPAPSPFWPPRTPGGLGAFRSTEKHAPAAPRHWTIMMDQNRPGQGQYALVDRNPEQGSPGPAARRSIDELKAV